MTCSATFHQSFVCIALIVSTNSQEAIKNASLPQISNFIAVNHLYFWKKFRLSAYFFETAGSRYSSTKCNERFSKVEVTWTVGWSRRPNFVCLTVDSCWIDIVAQLISRHAGDVDVRLVWSGIRAQNSICTRQRSALDGWVSTMPVHRWIFHRLKAFSYIKNMGWLGNTLQNEKRNLKTHKNAFKIV